MVQWLLEEGDADVRETDSHSNTALLWAAYEGHINVMKVSASSLNDICIVFVFFSSSSFFPSFITRTITNLPNSIFAVFAFEGRAY